MMERAELPVQMNRTLRVLELMEVHLAERGERIARLRVTRDNTNPEYFIFP